jgi:hypothetical protein
MMEGKTRTYFKRNKIETKQVCHQLYPNLLVVAQHEHGHRNEPLPQVDEDQENRRPKRKHTAIERYEACPSRESHQMLNNRSDDYRRRNRQKRPIRPRATECFDQKLLGSVAMRSIQALFQEQDATTPQKHEYNKQALAYFQKQTEEHESRLRSKKQRTYVAVPNESLPTEATTNETLLETVPEAESNRIIALENARSAR